MNLTSIIKIYHWAESDQSDLQSVAKKINIQSKISLKAPIRGFKNAKN